MSVLGTGIYPLSQAAKLLGTEPRALRRWLYGYARKYHGKHVRSLPLWTTQHEGQGLPGEVIGFRDLLEARMVLAFLQHGVNLKVIRATIEAASQQYGTDFPLTQRAFLTDGKRIFLNAVETATGEEKIIDVLKKQFVFSDIIKPSLYAGIEYGIDGATRWYPLEDKKTVVLDPGRQFGTPIITDSGIPTDTIYASYLAELRDTAMVARIFNLSPSMVDDAVEFEERLAA
ncbi:DUF433 domain-containing protein [Duganella sacchari]|nr:DUF433 domain-containing protein [Duganella sacchari]